jgi:hypothetical protein
LRHFNFITKVFICAGFFLLLAFITSCQDDSKSGGKGEGILEYDTKGVDPNHPLFTFAPSSATMKFKPEKFIIEMSTMGMFNTSVIVDSKAKTIAQTVKFLDIKQACIEKEADLAPSNEEYALKLEETKETKKIAGLKCYKVKATKIHEPNVSFDVWYTKELGSETCNALTPYAQLKGILMDYRIKKMGMELHFLAKSYKNVEIPDQAFEIPAAMKIVPKEEMEKFINNLQ